MMLTGENVHGDKRVSVPLHASQIPNETSPEWKSVLLAERPQLVGLLFPITETAFPTQHINIIVKHIRKLMAWN
jgi:hypothetical protein